MKDHLLRVEKSKQFLIKI